MRNIILFFLTISCLSLLSCREKKKTIVTADTTIEWRKKSWDFGELSRGEEVVHTFYFKNTGQEQLLIKKVEVGCGCTTVKYDKDPIPPGKEGKIEISFNSAGRYGKQYKEISIFANIPEKQAILSITANVKE